MPRMILQENVSWKASMRRMCRVCEEMYLPNGKTQKICDGCVRKRFKARQNARKKNIAKEKM